MKKFILAFTLSILFIALAAFLYNAYILQKEYFAVKDKKDLTKIEEIAEPVEIKSKYVYYSRDEYDKAILNKNVVVLFFTSNWCSSCLKQNQMNKNIFEEMSKKDILGLEIHILDSETTTESDALAKKFDVKKENTYVILDKKGAVYFKYTGEIAEEKLVENIMKAGDLK